MTNGGTLNLPDLSRRITPSPSGRRRRRATEASRRRDRFSSLVTGWRASTFEKELAKVSKRNFSGQQTTTERQGATDD